MPKPLVFQAGTRFNTMVARMFLDAGWGGTRDIANADLVCFTGGSDIQPRLYQEQRLPEVNHCDPARDDSEVKTFKAAKTLGIPMVGICRGAQLLNVLNGGTLYQHVTGHHHNHEVVDLRTNEVWLTTSTHHQMMRPAKNAFMIAAASDDKGHLSSKSTIKKAWGLTVTPDDKNFNVDPEILWYEDTMSLCFQGHPEFTSPTQTYERFWLYMDEFIMEPTVEAAASA